VADRPTPILIAHRGASAYAPEHTVPAYELGLEMGADFIEPDLQITRDGILIALHDETLDRTTDVQAVFPDRYREEEVEGRVVRRWHAADFTLEEIRLLDAGSWFDSEFAGVRIPTLQEVVELARGRAGIYPETKAPEQYADQGFSMERLLVDELRAAGLDVTAGESGPDAGTVTNTDASFGTPVPVIIQSFSAESLRILRDDFAVKAPLTFLLSRTGSDEWTTGPGLERIAEFADGIGPDRRLVEEDPALVERAHAAGLTVTPWTFRDRGDMVHFVCHLGVDGLFTDNPDRFPRPDDCAEAEARD